MLWKDCVWRDRENGKQGMEDNLTRGVENQYFDKKVREVVSEEMYPAL